MLAELDPFIIANSAAWRLFSTSACVLSPPYLKSLSLDKHLLHMFKDPLIWGYSFCFKTLLLGGAVLLSYSEIEKK